MQVWRRQASTPVLKRDIPYCPLCKTVHWDGLPDVCTNCGKEISSEALREREDSWVDHWDTIDIHGQKGVFIAYCKPGRAKNCDWWGHKTDEGFRSTVRHAQRDARVTFNRIASWDLLHYPKNHWGWDTPIPVLEAIDHQLLFDGGLIESVYLSWVERLQKTVCVDCGGEREYHNSLRCNACREKFHTLAEKAKRKRREEKEQQERKRERYRERWRSNYMSMIEEQQARVARVEPPPRRSLFVTGFCQKCGVSVFESAMLCDRCIFYDQITKP